MIKRLKVLFLTSWYPTRDHPVGDVFVREHAKAVQLYSDVTVLHYAGVDPSMKKLWRIEEEIDGNLTEGVPTYRVWYKPFPLLRISYFSYLWIFFQVFQRLLSQDFRPDVVHAHLYNMGLVAVLFGKLYRFPVLITEHSSAFPRRLLSFPEVLKARFAFRSSDLVSPVSHSLKQAIERYHIRARFQVIPNVVNTKLFFPKDNYRDKRQQKKILFVGTLRALKGMSDLLHALSQLRQRRDDWHLDILGDGPARVEYERLALTLRLADRVSFHGFKLREEVAEFMRQADVFVLPSHWENLPCVIIEAMASGLPIVATTVGGIPEIIDRDRGILIPPRDIHSLTEALEYMLEHHMSYQFGNIVSYAVDRFSYEIVGRQFYNVYLKILQESLKK